MQKIDYSQLELNPFTMIGNEAFLLTAGTMKDWNTMTAGWGGLGFIWGEPSVFVFVRESRYTLSFMDKYDRFTLSFFPPEMKKALDFCGSHSGRDTDKAKGAAITPVEVDGTVTFEEANLVFSCRKASKTLIDEKQILDSSVLKLYPQQDWHDMYIGYIDGVYIP